jgi:hypothetical protein
MSHGPYSGRFPTDLTSKVIQEGLLNRSGTLLWGDQELSLWDFCSALGQLMERSYFDDSYRQTFLWISQSSIHHVYEDGYDIFKVLQWVRSRHCLDDRDRISAILGLKYHVRYHYSRTVDDLYERLAYGTSKLGGTLRLLSSVHHGFHLKAWAEEVRSSWIPRWDEHLTSDLEHKNTKRALDRPWATGPVLLSLPDLHRPPPQERYRRMYPLRYRGTNFGLPPPRRWRVPERRVHLCILVRSSTQTT